VVLDQGSPDDALWLMPADGLPRRGDPAALGELLDSLAPLPVRLDLGTALYQARAILAGDERPGETLIVTDLQRSALSAATGAGPVTVVAPLPAPVANLGLADLAPGSQPWMPGRALVTLTVTGRDLPHNIRTGQSSLPTPVSQMPTGDLNVHEVEKELVVRALKEADGNRTAAAKKLGVSRRTLHRKLHEFHLEGF
jgi:hypothetical protein